jgi:Mor family transcriptional regulator
MSAARDHRILAVRPFHLAQIMSGALRAEGIEAVVERDVLSQVYALSTGRHGTRVFVPAHQLERARALIDEVEGRADD